MYKASKDDEITWWCVLYNMGAKFSPPIAEKIHVHRLVLPALLHGDFFHLFFNMISFFFFGFRAELLFQSRLKYFGLLVTGALMGNLMSAAFNKKELGVGFSTSLFSVMTVVIIWFFMHFDQLKAMAWFKMLILSFIVLF
jgi:membrane associated rhomboid family serine protease